MIIVENTAIAVGVSKSAKKIVNGNKDLKNLKILDYGAGKLRNAIYLNENKFNIEVFDTELGLKRIIDIIKKKNLNINIKTNDTNNVYDIVLCSFVLNVIKDEQTRIDILEDIFKSLKPNGKLYLELRNDEKTILNSKNVCKFKDGYLINRKGFSTFQKPFSKKDTTLLLNKLSSSIQFCVLEEEFNSKSSYILLEKH